VFILDGAHNPQGMAAAADSLRRHFGVVDVVFIVGAMADKDVGGMIRHIAPLAKSFYAVRPDNPRAMDAETLAAALSHYGKPVTACATIAAAVNAALREAGAGGVVCALGTLYFHAAVRESYQIRNV
jgi:dihydrofolate synthase/folylpolyglutamate synthase